jgi:hypothetical protein
MNSTRQPITVALVFIFVVAFFVGKFHLYQIIPHLDKYFHFLGGLIAGWFFSVYMASDFQTRGSRFRFFLAVVGAATLAGVLWEFAERLSSMYGTPLMQHYFYGGDIIDTLGDLAADIGGATLAALSIKQKTS